MCVRACVCTCPCVCMNVLKAEVDRACFPLSLSTWVLGTGSLIAYGAYCSGELASIPQLWDYRCQAFYLGAGDPNPSPYACLVKCPSHWSTSPASSVYSFLPHPCTVLGIMASRAWRKNPHPWTHKSWRGCSPSEAQCAYLVGQGGGIIASCGTKGWGYYLHINTQSGLSMTCLVMWFGLWE